VHSSRAGARDHHARHGAGPRDRCLLLPIVDPAAAVTKLEAFQPATSRIAQSALRSVLGKAELDQLLSEREQLNESLQQIIDERTEPWG
jgi:regulator of protease activity HflC (stomatin/prohibitin superfamily)